MYCGKCGKEIPEGQTICEDCINKLKTDNNGKNKFIIKKPVKIALIIILAIILLSVIIAIINMSNSTFKKANNLKENVENSNSIENKNENIIIFDSNNIEQFEEEFNSTSSASDSSASNNSDNMISNNNNNNNNNSNTNTNSTQKKEMIEMPYFQMGYELKEYTDKLDNLGIKYKTIKKQNLNYEDNTVINVEHNGENIEKGTTITITVADNIYDLGVRFDTYYLLELAGISATDYKNKTINVKVDVKGKNVFNGNLPLAEVDWADTAFTIKGKPDIRNDFEITVEGKKITKPIKTYYFLTHEIWVCKEFRIGS